MTAIAVNYIANPFSQFLKSFNRFFMILGYARAASELARLGYYKEAQHLMMQASELKKDK